MFSVSGELLNVSQGLLYFSDSQSLTSLLKSHRQMCHICTEREEQITKSNCRQGSMARCWLGNSGKFECKESQCRTVDSQSAFHGQLRKVPLIESAFQTI